MTTRIRTDYIVVHCSATRPSQHFDVDDIRKWHKAKGWDDVGYHYVITRDGCLQAGRPTEAVGSHVQGYNHNSIGICLVGGIAEDDLQPENNFTKAQFGMLESLLRSILIPKYPSARIQGHRDFAGVKKACPSFDVAAWLREVGL